MLKPQFPSPQGTITLLAVVALSALLLRSVAFAQTSVSNGSISGTVTDTTGAVVPNAKVTITGPTGLRSTWVHFVKAVPCMKLVRPSRV